MAFPARFSTIAFSILFCLIGIRQTKARIIHVPIESPSIKAAIAIAEEPDTIMVSPGTFSGPDNTDIELARKAITVMSLKGPTATVIDCQGSRQDPHRAFYIHQGEGFRTVVKGFTIIRGFAPFDQDSLSMGGGMLCAKSSSPTISDCVFYDNRAVHAGGGLYVDSSSPTLTECVFVDNVAIDDLYQTMGGYGGGVRCNNASPIFTDCAFTSNRANFGGGISCDLADITLERCEFSNNVADVVVALEPILAGAGGALHLSRSSPNITGCTFDRNTAIQGMNMGMQSAKGGGIYSYLSSSVIEQSTFYGNTAEAYGEQLPGQGAGLYFTDSPISLRACLIAFNTGGEAIYRDSTDTLNPIAISCSDIYANENGDWIGPIAIFAGQDGNISDDPLFCDTAAGSLELRGSSPCAAANNSCGETIGAFDVGCDTDVDGDDAASHVTADIDLGQNYPNPFNRGTVIRYTLPRQSHVEIVVFNAAGQSVRRLVDGVEAAGFHRIFWDGYDDRGRDVATGIYFYRLQAEDVMISRKMILLK